MYVHKSLRTNCARGWRLTWHQVSAKMRQKKLVLGESRGDHQHTGLDCRRDLHHKTLLNPVQGGNLEDHADHHDYEELECHIRCC